MKNLIIFTGAIVSHCPINGGSPDPFYHVPYNLEGMSTSELLENFPNLRQQSTQNRLLGLERPALIAMLSEVESEEKNRMKKLGQEIFELRREMDRVHEIFRSDRLVELLRRREIELLQLTKEHPDISDQLNRVLSLTPCSHKSEFAEYCLRKGLLIGEHSEVRRSCVDSIDVKKIQELGEKVYNSGCQLFGARILLAQNDRRFRGLKIMPSLTAEELTELTEKHNQNLSTFDFHKQKLIDELNRLLKLGLDPHQNEFVENCLKQVLHEQGFDLELIVFGRSRLEIILSDVSPADLCKMTKLGHEISELRCKISGGCSELEETELLRSLEMELLDLNAKYPDLNARFNLALGELRKISSKYPDLNPAFDLLLRSFNNKQICGGYWLTQGSIPKLPLSPISLEDAQTIQMLGEKMLGLGLELHRNAVRLRQAILRFERAYRLVELTVEEFRTLRDQYNEELGEFKSFRDKLIELISRQGLIDQLNQVLSLGPNESAKSWLKKVLSAGPGLLNYIVFDPSDFEIMLCSPSLCGTSPIDRIEMENIAKKVCQLEDDLLKSNTLLVKAQLRFRIKNRPTFSEEEFREKRNKHNKNVSICRLIIEGLIDNLTKVISLDPDESEWAESLRQKLLNSAIIKLEPIIFDPSDLQNS